MFDRIAELTATLPDWLAASLAVIVSAAIGLGLGLIAHYLLFRVLWRIARTSRNDVDDILVRRLVRPTRYAFLALGLVLAAREAPVLEDGWQRIAGFVMPAILGWTALAVLNGLVEALELRADISHENNLKARRKRTRLAIFGRIATFIIVFVTVGLMLLSIPSVRDIGVTLVASAGLAGIAVGAAAQPALKSLIAGLQMAVTEPIAIDDVVVVDGEWGRIEDIRTTYVVVQTWDERRLIVPTVKFLEETFQNWTKHSAQLLTPVFLYLDPLTDIAPLRAEFLRQVKQHPLWDKRVSTVQVTETTPESIQVRLLMSASNSGNAATLSNEIRETMLAWIREHHPDAIPRRRLLAAESAEAAG